MLTWKHPQTNKPSVDEFDFDVLQSKRTPEKTEKNTREEIFDMWDQDMLDKNFRTKCLHPDSQALQVNTSISEKEYEKILEPHNDWRNYYKAKELWLNDEIKQNVGRKLHINILPENIIAVDKYLNDNWFVYKYLHWGELIDGKIFTIYIGSYETTKIVAERISHDIRKYLCKPEDHSEIEFAPGVVWRFKYRSWANDPRKSAPYGTCGFSVDRTLKSLWITKMELISYRRLQSKFGKYFHK